MVLSRHVDYTCIGNQLAVSYGDIKRGRISRAEKIDRSWDQVWVGAHIATMVAGPGRMATSPVPRLR
jgi:hypothetical protein